MAECAALFHPTFLSSPIANGETAGWKRAQPAFHHEPSNRVVDNTISARGPIPHPAPGFLIKYSYLTNYL